MSVYSDFIDSPVIVTNLIQDIVLICYDSVKFLIKETNKKVMGILNLPEKKESDLLKNLSNIYQDNYQTIFKLDEERLSKIKQNYKKNATKILDHNYENEFYNFPENFEHELENEDSSPKDDGESGLNEFKVHKDEDYKPYFE